MTEVITETVSKKRGRPTRFDPAWVAAVRGLYPELRSKRQIIAKCYESRAIELLKDSDGVDAIFDKASTYHATILEQFGRLREVGIASDDDVVAAAEWLSDKLKVDSQFTVRKAVALIRLLREEVIVRMIIGCSQHPPGKLLPLLLKDMGDTQQ